LLAAAERGVGLFSGGLILRAASKRRRSALRPAAGSQVKFE